MQTPTQRQKLMRRFRRECDRWLSTPSAQILKTEPLLDLQEWLPKADPDASVVCARQLHSMALWHGQAAAKAILAGDANGWVHAETWFFYNWWYLRIGGSILIYEWNHCLAHAIMLEEWAMARWIANTMPKGHALWLQNKRPQRFSFGLIAGWDFSHFAHFLLHLWAIHTNTVPPKLEGAGLGPYRRIIDAWGDGPELIAAFENACDYHLDQATDAGDDTREFLNSSYDLFPVDILAIATVRKHLGLSMPVVDHPLMQTPLAHPPPPEQRPRLPPDPLLDAVIAKARSQGFLPPNPKDDFEPVFEAPVWNADSVGWTNLDEVFQYAIWQFRIQGDVAPDEANIHRWNYSLGYAIIVQEDAMARWVAHTMVEGHKLWLRDKRLQYPVDGRIFGWKKNNLAVFLLHLWALYTRTPAPELKPSAGLGPYRKILDAWNENGPMLAAALKEACDHHIEQTTSKGRDDLLPYPEFPWEILVVMRVREALGLPTPEVDHPFMKTPLVTYRPRGKRPQTPVCAGVDNIVAFARKEGQLPPEGGDDFAI